MGAQIISAAIYWYLKEEGREVFADLSYFDGEERIATVGNKGEVSHWSWQLDPFDLSRSSFEAAAPYSRRDVELIEDGPQKLMLGVKALRQPWVQNRLPIAGVPAGVLPADFANGYLCAHVRRGDYVNVASHLVSDREFFELAGKFAGLMKHLVVVSDSPIEEAFRKRISEGYEQVAFLDDVDAYTSHCVMRTARILVCSNSQFSLIAALLNPQALVVLPKQWFGAKDRAIEAPIHEACGFQILRPNE
ncbi:MAG: alpha-1,2-fucosyltransferase [Nitrosomonadales bacterium]|nr:alpha-1,2-fucosyltransferase [Nitrosomonadales bacterium]